MNIKLSIVVPVFNNINFTMAALKDLVKLPIDHEIIIVDNNSTDDTEEKVKQFIIDNNSNKPKLVYVKLDSNTGFAHASNYGYKISQGQYVLFLNNDIKVKSNHDNWTNDLLTILFNDCSCLVGPTGGLIDNNCNFIRETSSLEMGNFYMSGWCLGGSKKVFDSLIINNYEGPFSEEFGLGYFEDTDLGLRATEAGVHFHMCDVPVHHFGHMTSKKIGLSMLYAHAKKIFEKKWKNKLNG